MKRNIMLLAALMLSMIMFVPGSAISSDCSKTMVDAMLEEGLSQEQINRICLKAAMKEEGLSDEQISRIILKTGVLPTVQNPAAQAPQVPQVAQPVAAAPATAAPAPPPKNLNPDFPTSKIESDIIGKCVGGILGWCFAKDEYREIEILETKVDHDYAEVIFHLSTIKNHAGKLHASYRRAGSEWELDKLSPINFR